MRLLALSILLLPGCAASVIPAFEAARDEALRMPGPAPKTWRPDAVLRLSQQTVDQALLTILQEEATLTQRLELGLATIRPRLTISGIKVRRATKCGECLQLDVDLEGTVRVETALGTTRVPVDGGATFDVALDLARATPHWELTATPRSIQSVRLGLGTVVAGVGNLSVFLQDWVDDNLVSSIGTQTIADLGDATLPFRAVSVVPGEGSIELRLLTESGVDEVVVTDKTAPASGWSLEMSSPALLALARRASMGAEPLDFDVVAEPTRLAIDDDAFELGLRLWRVAGRGWWRDYEITGAVEAKPKRVVLVPTDVKQIGSSPGAALVDPLAFLGQGVILRTIESALNTSMPSSRRETFQGLQATLLVEEVQGGAGTVIIDGSLDLTGTGEPTDRPKKR